MKAADTSRTITNDALNRAFIGSYFRQCRQIVIIMKVSVEYFTHTA
jgi:hypothetical protein